MSSHPTGFKRTALRGLVLGALAASGAAHAVFEDPHGVGQALVYPYYTVQTANGNSFNTYLSVVNTTTRAKAVKVRFREGQNARPVLDFNLYLSPNDVWTAALGPADATPTSPALMVTRDKSCTAPPIPVEGVTFRNYAYAGVQADAGPTTLDRTREGYFEIIEMANLTGGVATAVTHGVSGTPANCAAVQPTNGFTAATNSASLLAPSGGLAGTYTLINVANGLNFGGNATALARFSAVPIFSDNGSDAPNLASANPPVALVTQDSGSTLSTPGTMVYVGTYANGRDAVSATMMRSGVMNEYALDLATKSETDWVLTFPTKLFYASNGVGAAFPPFTSNFSVTGACEPYSTVTFDREELGDAQPCDSLCPPPPVRPGLCFAAQVVAIARGNSTLTTSQVLGSANVLSIPVGSKEHGWARLGFTGTAASTTGLSSVAGTGTVMNVNSGASVSGATVNHRGLPVIGFMARTLNNGALSCITFGGSPGACAGSYGAAFDHKYQSTVSPTP